MAGAWVVLAGFWDWWELGQHLAMLTVVLALVGNGLWIGLILTERPHELRFDGGVGRLSAGSRSWSLSKAVWVRRGPTLCIDGRCLELPCIDDARWVTQQLNDWARGSWQVDESCEQIE